jgi:hypothetical protein
MKLYFYQGLDKEKVPKDVTHAIVAGSVAIIKRMAFFECRHLVSIIMDDNVRRIEERSFFGCTALRIIQLSKTLESIGIWAFGNCYSLEALFLPSTVKSIGYEAFKWCRSMRVLILPHDIDLSNVGRGIISHTGIYQIAQTAGVAYENKWFVITEASNRRVNEWLIHHMDESPFHKLCYNSSITTVKINDYLIANSNKSALQIDLIHDITPLQLLTMNPRAPADAIAALLYVNLEAAFRVGSQGKTPLDYGREYNAYGLFGMINILCTHRHAA